MKILIAGDTHGNEKHIERVFSHAQNEECELIIQVGDFGYGWSFDPAGNDRFSLRCAELVDQTGIEIWWLGGNHENYDDLYAKIGDDLPKGFEMFPGVVYLGRGYSFVLDDVKFLACGGAVSVDRRMRVPYVSWWPQEAINNVDIERCKVAGKVDVLLTHDFAWESDIVDRHLDSYWGEVAQRDTEANRRRVSEILHNCDADRMFHGHLHHFYSEMLSYSHGGMTRDIHRTHVSGLGKDMDPLWKSTMIFDTEEFNEKKRK